MAIPMKEKIQVYLPPAEKQRIENYLEKTYGGSLSSFLRRLALEKVTAWEEHQITIRGVQHAHTT